MTEKKITLSDIRNYVEFKSGISDISINTRKREVSDLKKIYCRLSKMFTSNSLEAIGKGLRENYTHDKVLYCLKKFDEVYPTGGLKCSYVYDLAYEHFSKINGISPVVFGDSDIEKAYSKKINKLIHSFFIQIEQRDDKIKLLQSQNKKLKRKIEFFNKQILSKI